MSGFSFNATRTQVEDNAKVSVGRHNVRITRIGAVINKNDEPMLIPTFTIEDSADSDDGKELTGFISFPNVFSDMQYNTLHDFLVANEIDLEALDGYTITVEMLKEWGSKNLIGNLLTIESGYGKGAYATKPIARNYFKHGATQPATELIDLE